MEIGINSIFRFNWVRARAVCEYHNNHPQKVDPRVIPQKQVFQVDTDKEKLYNHPCDTNHGNPQ